MIKRNPKHSPSPSLQSSTPTMSNTRTSLFKSLQKESTQKRETIQTNIFQLTREDQLDDSRSHSGEFTMHYPKEVERFIKSQKNASIYKQRQKIQRQKLQAKIKLSSSPQSQFNSDQKFTYLEAMQKVCHSVETKNFPVTDSADTPPLKSFNNYRIRSNVNLKFDYLKMQLGEPPTQQSFTQKQQTRQLNKPSDKKTFLHSQDICLTVGEMFDQDKRGIVNDDQLDSTTLQPLIETIIIPNRISYNSMFKNYDKLSEYQEVYQTKPNIYSKMNQTVSKLQLLPKQLGLMRYKQNAITSVVGSKQYVEVLSEALQTSTFQNIKSLRLSGNNLSNKDVAKICDQLPTDTQILILNNNKMRKDVGYVFSQVLGQKSTKLQCLNLENNNILDSGVDELMQQLEDNRQLKILNISKNNLSDRCVESLSKLIKKSYNLCELYLHYNGFVQMGTFFKALNKNSNLKVLDLSFNRLACSEDIANMIGKPHPELYHLDISYNRLSIKDIQLIQKQLIFNDVMCGLHIEGNVDGYYINARGFLVSKDEPQNFQVNKNQSQFQSHDQLIDPDEYEGRRQEIEIKVMKSEQNDYAPLFHRRVEGVNILGLRKENAQLQDCCWICEGWVEVKFTWIPGVSGGLKEPPLFLHLDCDNYRPMLMHFQNEQFELSRMCPPNKLVQYFYSNPLEEIYTYARDQKTHETEAHSYISNFGLELRYADGTQVQAKKMKVVNVHQTGPPALVIDSLHHYTLMVMSKPREPEPIYEIDKSKALLRKWTLENSWFKDFEPDSKLRMNECLDFDISMMKMGRFIKDDASLIAVLQKQYPQILSLYYYYTSFTPNYHFPRVTQKSVQEFIDQSNVIQRNLLKQSDVDIHFITTHTTNLNKVMLFVEDRSLVRHQFLEFAIRVAKDSYVRGGICSTLGEAIDLLLQDHLSTVRASQEWRDQRYWTQLMDLTINFKMPIIKSIFNSMKVNHPSHCYITTQDFISLLQKCDLINANFTEQEAFMVFQQSMVTQIDSVTKNRHCQMTMIEFTEALARIAEKISPSSPSYKQKNLKLSQRRILPLFVKFEGLLFMFYHLLDLKNEIFDKTLPLSTILKTRQARKLGLKADESSSSSEGSDAENLVKLNPMIQSHRDLNAIFQGLVPVSDDDDNHSVLSHNSLRITTRRASKKMSSIEQQSSTNISTPSNYLTKNAQMMARSELFKKSLTSFNPASLVTHMEQFALKADIQEQAEMEESSPLTKAQMRKLKYQRSRFNEGLSLKQDQFQFD